MSNLLIVESPAKCQKIRSFLGPDWTVLATMGHLRALDESLEGIGLGTGWSPTPNPSYHWLKEKAKAIQALKSAVQQEPKPCVYLAADDDREGEMIAYSVCLLLRLPPATTPRIVFHEITERAIRHALDHPRTLDMNRVHAQQARAMLDLMIGFTISPLLWKHVARTLSAGRCQTPALRLVVEREEAIESFVSSHGWALQATWMSLTTPTPIHTTTDELEDEESVLQVLTHASQTPTGRLIRQEIRPWTESAPEPLITSTLQQQASQLYHCSPKQTMSIAQRLYEAGHITYMRTDKATMSDEAQEQARTWVRSHLGEEYVQAPRAPQAQEKKKRPRTAKQEKNKPNAQEAHEAIRPTHMEVTTLPVMDWGSAERNIYQLISRRALQSVMSPARGERCLLTIQMDDLEELEWVSEEKRTHFEGWRRLGRVASVEDQPDSDQKENQDQDKDQKEQEWPTWEIGAVFTWTEIQAKETESKSQTRYTEASLVSELEKHGIGRPSTFASLLSVIQEKTYVAVEDIPPVPVERAMYQMVPSTSPRRTLVKEMRGGEKRKLVPTALGRSVWSWLSSHFNDLFAYEFTATMERNLDHIAQGEQEEREVLITTWESYRDRYELLLSSSSSSPGSSSSSSSSASQTSSLSLTASSKQRIFQGGLKAIQTKKGPLLLREGVTKDATQFFGWPKGVSWEKMTEEKALAHVQQSQGYLHMEWQGKPVIKKTGQYGPYLLWDAVSVPFVEGEAPEETGVRLERKKNPVTDSSADSSAASQTSSSSLTSILKETTHYMVRNGPYGPYLLKKTKTATKGKSVCVSVPKGLDVSELTDKDLAALYTAGLEKKRAQKNNP